MVRKYKYLLLLVLVFLILCSKISIGQTKYNVSLLLDRSSDAHAAILPVYVRGKLLLTEEKFIFTPSHYKKYFKPIELNINEIEQVTPKFVLLFIPNKLKIISKNKKTYYFSTYKRNKIAKFIKANQSKNIFSENNQLVSMPARIRVVFFPLFSELFIYGNIKITDTNFIFEPNGGTNQNTISVPLNTIQKIKTRKRITSDRLLLKTMTGEKYKFSVQNKDIILQFLKK